MTFDEKIDELCKEIPEEDRAEVLTFVRFLRHVPGFREELHSLAEPGERLPSLDVIEALMEKWKDKLVTE